MTTKQNDGGGRARKAPKKPLVVRSRRPSGAGPTKLISVLFPSAYLHVIESEGRRLGLTRGNFLSMLVRRQNGIVHFERPSDAPTYEVTEDDLNEKQKYMWESPVDVRQMIDAGRLRLGKIPVAAYLMLLVNSWLGTPMGLPIVASKGKR